MKHTEGPWAQNGRWIYAPEAQAMICEMSEPRASKLIGHEPLKIGSPDHKEAMANAALIIAAPDLAETLEPFAALYHSRLDDLADDAPLYQHCDSIVTVGDVRRARAALERAKGAE